MPRQALAKTRDPLVSCSNLSIPVGNQTSVRSRSLLFGTHLGEMYLAISFQPSDNVAGMAITAHIPPRLTVSISILHVTVTPGHRLVRARPGNAMAGICRAAPRTVA